MDDLDYVLQGLPLHVLLVHVVVIAVPAIAALLVVLAVLIGAWQLVTADLRRRAERDATPMPRPLSVSVSIALGVAALVVAAGATWTVIQIGESGSRAVWEGSFSETPLER